MHDQGVSELLGERFSLQKFSRNLFGMAKLLGEKIWSLQGVLELLCEGFSLTEISLEWRSCRVTFLKFGLRCQ